MRTQPLTEVRAKLTALGADLASNAPAEFAAMINVETAPWTRIVKHADIKVE